MEGQATLRLMAMGLHSPHNTHTCPISISCSAPPPLPQVVNMTVRASRVSWGQKLHPRSLAWFCTGLPVWPCWGPPRPPWLRWKPTRRPRRRRRGRAC